MNSQEYWQQRMLYFKKQQLVSSAEYEDAMRSRLKDLEKAFEKEALVYLNRYATENNTTLKEAARVLNGITNHKWSMSLAEFEAKAKAGGYERILNTEYYKSRVYRLQQLHDQMVEVAKRYSVNEEIRMRNELIKAYDDTYLYNNFIKDKLTGQLNIKLNQFNEQELADIVYKPWNGNSFSQRIWNNYTKVLPDVLTDTMLRATVFGYSPSRAVSELRNTFSTISTTNLHRLVVTEMGHAAEEATAQFYHDSDIKQYEYLATLESHTCDQCRRLDNKVFNLKDRVEGVNYPIMHPYCRCTTVPYIEGLSEASTRWAGKNTWIDNLSFSDWKKSLNIEPLRLTTSNVDSKYKQLNDLSKVDLSKILDDGIETYLAHEWDYWLSRNGNSYRPLAEEKKISKKTQMKEQFSKLAKMIADDGNDVQLYIKSANLKKALQNGFKNQIELGDSSAFYDPETRKNVEWKIFTDESEKAYREYQKRKPEDFAIYGKIGRRDSYDERTARTYGEVAVHFKSDIRNRTTYTIGDSLANGYTFIKGEPTWKAAKIGDISPTAVSPVLGSGMGLYTVDEIFRTDNIDFMSKYSTIDDLTSNYGDARYVEAQIHGKVTADDIEFVEFPKTLKAKGLIKILDKLNIEYRVK